MNALLKNKVRGFAGLVLLAVFLLSLSPAYGGTITENFIDNQFNINLWGLWKALQGTTVQVDNNRLEVTVAGSGYAGIAGYGFTLVGDFDMQVDFTLLTWPPANKTQVYITATNKLSSLFQIGRGNIGPFGDNPSKELYFISDAFGISQTANVTGPDMSGTLRLVRTGNKMEGFYWNGSAWQSIGSATHANLGSKVMIFLGAGPYYDYYSGISAKAAFSNIQISYTTLGRGFWQQGNPASGIMELLLQ
jgi:hypothetical protein